MSNFEKIITEKGYKIIEQEKEKITISKLVYHSEFRITFFLDEKKVHGFIIPSLVLLSKYDIERLNKNWEKLCGDVKEFADLSHYDIMN